MSLTAGGEWEIDAAEIMQGVVDEAEPGLAQKPEPEREPESYTLRHLGEERSVGRGVRSARAAKGGGGAMSSARWRRRAWTTTASAESSATRAGR